VAKLVLIDGAIECMKIYIEGAGPTEAAQTECRRAFEKFFLAAGLKGRMPRLVACGSRNEAYDKFKIAFRNGDNALLLVDSEEPIRIDSSTDKPISPRVHVKERDGWDCPSGATDDHIYFMAVCMESWFIADKEQFVNYYSTGNRRCNPSTIPENIQVETLKRPLIFKILQDATTSSGKAQYSKGSRSFDILSIISPRKVSDASVHARQLFCHLGVKQSWLDCSDINK